MPIGNLTRESYIFIILGISLFIVEPDCQGQEIASVSEPKLTRKDNLVYITYDFLSGELRDTFNVAADISDVFGNRIHESALSGDIGNNVSVGQRKIIVWNLNVDRIYMEDDINVKILVRNRIPVEISRPIRITEIKPAETVSVDAEALPVSDEALPVSDETLPVSDEALPVSDEASIKDFSRSGIVIQSLFFPGLGLSRVKGKPHWLRGLAGYGCVAGSLLYKHKANETRSDYDAATLSDWKTFYYDVSVWQDNISKAFVAGAIIIWASDFIWTLAGTSELKRVQLYGNISGISMGTVIVPPGFMPVVGLRYTF